MWISGTPVAASITSATLCIVSVQSTTHSAPAASSAAASAASSRPAVKRLRQRDHAMRCTLAPGPDGMQLDPQSAQESHLIAQSAAHADAIAFIDHGDGEVAAGELVQYGLL